MTLFAGLVLYFTFLSFISFCEKKALPVAAVARGVCDNGGELCFCMQQPPPPPMGIAVAEREGGERYAQRWRSVISTNFGMPVPGASSTRDGRVGRSGRSRATRQRVVGT